ncbi:MAG: hypothetical protein AAFQ14_18090, partial [Cyanobacteria bacterium J06621_12]
MSTFVIGALGFGLMQVLRTTRSDVSKTAARNETSRALDFISDEMRRAIAIKVDNSLATVTPLAPGFTPLTKDDGSGGTTDIEPSLVLEVPGVTGRIIYTVAPPQTDTWKGPLVIYRWGPQLDGDGNYTSTFTSEALVDKISDESQTTICGKKSDGTDKTINYQGFYACTVDDDGDGLVENATDTNGDGVITKDDNATDTNGDDTITSADGWIDFNGDGTIDEDDGYEDENKDGIFDVKDTKLIDTNGDGAITKDDNLIDLNGDGKINRDDSADVDGKAITAQLYFTGGTTTAGGDSSTYSADTKIVARARTAPENRSAAFTAGTMSFRTLSPSFSCNPPSTDWQMRTDFGESLDSPGSLANWNHEENRQPQPIKLTGSQLVISSVPRGIDPSVDCLNRRANNGRESTNPTDPRDYSGNKGLGEKTAWKDNADVVAISHVIDFGDPTTFNGDIKDTCDAHSVCGGSIKVNDGESDTMNTSVMMLKRGSVVPDYGGYDANDNGDRTESGDQPSLGEFLASKGLATNTGTTDNPVYTIISVQEAGKPPILGDDERIIAFEIGYEVSTTDTTPSDTTSPGI